MKFLACLLLAKSAAEKTRTNSFKSLHRGVDHLSVSSSEVHHEAFTSWGHHASAAPATAALDPQAHAALRKTGPALLGVKAAQHKQTHYLRLCNAFAYTTAFDVYRGEPPGAVEKLTKNTGPLPYKRCFDMTSVHLHQGDRLQFRIGDAHLGSFAIDDIHPDNMMLLLVFFRNDRLTTAMRFASHAFQDKYQPQIAVIDTYLGPSRSFVEISDQTHAAHIRYDNVVTVQTGTYDVALNDNDRVVENSGLMHIDAEARETYVVMRTGVKAFEGPAYPEQLVTFPGGWSAAVVEKLSAVVLLAVMSSLYA